jgi:hypothetical protein
MRIQIRKMVVHVEEVHHVQGQTDERGPLLKVAAAAIIENPYAGKGFVPDLQELIDASDQLGTLLGKRCLEACNGRVESYGKAGIVGTNGAQEHAHAALTSVFGDAFRTEIGGGKAWIASTKKVAAAGSSIDVPLAHKDEIWVRDHYDAITLTVADAPLPDELMIIAAASNMGRIAARVGGLSAPAETDA